MLPPGVKLRSVRFDLFAPEASSVCVAGNFNNWNPQASPLRPMQAGKWRLPMRLPPGKYEYRFLVDGRWRPDPAARHQVTNFCGTMNSVLLVE